MVRYDLQLIKPWANENKDGVVLFTMVKNEAYLLPHFFDHYRHLGVNRFLIYDDKSSDSSLDILSKQDDCMVLTSENNYNDEVKPRSEKYPPIRWCGYIKAKLPALVAPDGWTLTVDADEFLILPKGFEHINHLIEELELRGLNHMTAPMVDFYPSSLFSRNYDSRLSPFVGSPYFDSGPLYGWKDRVRPKQFANGIRARLLKEFYKDDREAVMEIYGDHPISLAKTWKVPLLKQGCGVFLVNEHEINKVPDLEIAGALAHFKFTPSLDEKTRHALRTGSYYNGSLEYRFLYAVMEKYKHRSLLSNMSRIFTGAESLVEADLLTVL